MHGIARRARGLTRELRHVEMSGVEYLKCVLGPPIKYLLNLSSTFPYTLDTEPQNVRHVILIMQYNCYCL
jgi:hypothetical protein